MPEVVAAGEWIGPWGALRSYLMVAELVGHAPLHEAVPELARSLGRRPSSPRSSGRLVIEMAEIAAKLHAAHAFHKDLYLCHFFLDLGADARAGSAALPDRPPPAGRPSLDVARVAVEGPRPAPLLDRGVDGIDDRDRLRFWMHYRTAIEDVLAAPPAPLHPGQGRPLPGPQPLKTGRTSIHQGTSMRLALNFQRIDPARGGAETYVVDLCHRLVRAGHEVDLFAERWKAGALPPEVRTIRVDASGWTRWERTWSFAANSERAFRERGGRTTTARSASSTPGTTT